MPTSGRIPEPKHPFSGYYGPLHTAPETACGRIRAQAPFQGWRSTLTWVVPPCAFVPVERLWYGPVEYSDVVDAGCRSHKRLMSGQTDREKSRGKQPECRAECREMHVAQAATGSGPAVLATCGAETATGWSCLVPPCATSVVGSRYPHTQCQYRAHGTPIHYVSSKLSRYPHTLRQYRARHSSVTQRSA
eukprot:2842125-Rhodomonas_salina.2